MSPKASKALTGKGPTKPVSPTKGGIATSLLSDVRELILSTRHQVAQTVNAGTTMLYWHVGRRIQRDILKEKRADYGKRIVSALARQLESEFGRGFGEKNLRRMVQFADQFPDEYIVAALLRQLGWTHFTMLLPINDPLKRDFYAEMCSYVATLDTALDSRADPQMAVAFCYIASHFGLGLVTDEEATGIL